MESEEAIMENENNSNVESQSNIRDLYSNSNDPAATANTHACGEETDPVTDGRETDYGADSQVGVVKTLPSETKEKGVNHNGSNVLSGDIPLASTVPQSTTDNLTERTGGTQLTAETEIKGKVPDGHRYHVGDDQNADGALSSSEFVEQGNISNENTNLTEQSQHKGLEECTTVSFDNLKGGKLGHTVESEVAGIPHDKCDSENQNMSVDDIEGADMPVLSPCGEKELQQQSELYVNPGENEVLRNDCTGQAGIWDEDVELQPTCEQDPNQEHCTDIGTNGGEGFPRQVETKVKNVCFSDKGSEEDVCKGTRVEDAEASGVSESSSALEFKGQRCQSATHIAEERVSQNTSEKILPDAAVDMEGKAIVEGDDILCKESVDKYIGVDAQTSETVEKTKDEAACEIEGPNISVAQPLDDSQLSSVSQGKDSHDMNSERCEQKASSPNDNESMEVTDSLSEPLGRNQKLSSSDGTISDIGEKKKNSDLMGIDTEERTALSGEKTSNSELTSTDTEETAALSQELVQAQENVDNVEKISSADTVVLDGMSDSGVESVREVVQPSQEIKEEQEPSTKSKNEIERDTSEDHVSEETNILGAHEAGSKTSTGASCKEKEQLLSENEVYEVEMETCQSNNSETDVVICEVSDVKKELVEHSEKEVTAGTKIQPADELDLKEEGAKRKFEEEDVVMLDAEGEFVPVKRGSADDKDFKAVENGLGIQISAVSGQQHQLHANAEAGSESSLLPGSNQTSPVSKRKSGKSKSQTCIVCHKCGRCKFNIVRNGDIKYLCDDVCFKTFRASPSVFLKYKGPNHAPKEIKKTASNVEGDNNPILKEVLKTPPENSAANPGYKTCAVCQLMNLNTLTFCNWKGLDFCGESCLGKFQANLNTTCSYCQAYIPMDMRASFCLKIGNDMRPFCKQKCYNEFKKMLKLCAFCQQSLAAIPSAFTAVVGNYGKHKDFCSKECLKKMEDQFSDVEIVRVEKGGAHGERIACSVCKKKGTKLHTVRFQGEVNKLCSDLCLSAFRYTNNISMNKCDSCGTLCTPEESRAHFAQFEGQLKRFCSDQCVNTFRKSNSKMVPCVWCGTKKFNFDMIERVDVENKYQMFCTLKCLSLYRVNLQAKSNLAIPCDQCRKVVPAQYHLTMSDASVRNFCSYDCVMTFQSQFISKPPAISVGITVPTTPPATNVKSQGRMSTRQTTKKQSPAPPPIPVITNVMSLAPPVDVKAPPPVKIAPATSAPASTNTPPNAQSNLALTADGKQRILIQTEAPKQIKNKSVQSRPAVQTKAISCRPNSQSKEVQTEESAPKCVMVPIPVPIYIPMPTMMFNCPVPQIMPVPIPVPVPMFIPTTRKSANGISKTIKEIVERMPADPLEAELLMMAEAVASDTRAGDSDTDSEDATVEEYSAPDDDTRLPQRDDEIIIRKREGGREEDMIQMALRMAEEMTGPIDDLESSVEPVVVSSEPPTATAMSQMQSFPSHHQVEGSFAPVQTNARSTRGSKRPGRGRPSAASRPKRQKIERQYGESEQQILPQPQPPPSTEPPADAEYRLKFTYGVNAWKHWVVNKNAQIEKTKQASGSYRIRTFPTDMLKCTTDELNFTLCLFIKEVRKPNGDEYSPDSVYYLCLGIQQYLYENGRIDNIFTDLYFEKFTDSLHEVLKTLQPKVNSQGQMLCRIEEEHLWESKQLGAHSPYVLLNTLIYFHTKHFILKTAQEHMSLSFAQILKHWKKGMPVKGQSTSGKNVSLRFYCLANGKKDGLAARKSKEGVPVYEVTENFDNPLRCPVKLYEFFLSKCPESIKNRNDIFYPVPERSCVPDSPVWYSTQSIDIHTMDKMLTRVLLVREIQESHLHAQPIYL